MSYEGINGVNWDDKRSKLGNSTKYFPIYSFLLPIYSYFSLEIRCFSDICIKMSHFTPFNNFIF